jgi:anti-sigma factor RsiW
VTIGWDHLNAYVDGELAPAEAARVAAAVARDPHLAARIATLSRLKATTAGLSPPGEAPPAPRPRASPSGWRFGALAASVAVMIAGAAALWSWSAGSGRQSAWLGEAVAAQHAWLDRGASLETGDRIEVALRAWDIARIPDLSEARLSLVHVALVPGDGRPQGVLLGYQGIHGCHVGLWIGGTVSGLGDRPVKVESADVAGYAWRDAGTGYALLARGMDPGRLKLLADAVFRITRNGQRVDERIQTALRETTETGRPCAV